MFMPKVEEYFKGRKVGKYALIIIAVYLVITLPFYWYLKSSIDPNFIQESESFVLDKISSLPLNEREYEKLTKRSKINSYFYTKESSYGEVVSIELDTASPSFMYYSIEYKVSGKRMIIHASVMKHDSGEMELDSLWLQQFE